MALSSDEAFLAVLWKALNDARLEAILVGSAAAAVQGAPVTTQDFDILIRDTPLNRTKLDEVASRIGAARPRKLSPLAKAVTMVGGEIPIDVLFDELVGALKFEIVRSRAVSISLGDVTIVSAALADIIASKRAANRPKDQAQLPILESTLRVLQELKNKGD
jgi:predicted nucleotidyltransferase